MIHNAQQNPRENDCRCAVCLTEYKASEHAHTDAVRLKRCPFCKTQIPPLKLSSDGYVKVNWQDLRVLCIYALRWSTNFNLAHKANQDALTALHNIIHAFEKYQPKGELTIVPEIDVVVIDAHRQIGEIVFEDGTELKKDKDGKYPSPFYKKLPGENN